MYANGRVPLSKLIHRGDNIYLTPSLNARWNEAVRLALKKYGVRLWITGDIDGLGGWNGYRPYDAQVRYKNHYGRYAAAAGWSSHGGVYGGREVFALDVANWQQLGGTEAQAWGRFVAIMRLVGLTTNFVSPKELWHVGDFNNPWVAPTFGRPSGGTTTKPVTPPKKEESEEDEMKNSGVYYTRDSKTIVYLMFNTGSGWYHEFSNGKNAGAMPGSYNNALAGTLATDSWAKITESHARVLKASLDAVRNSKVSGSLSVTIEEDVDQV